MTNYFSENSWNCRPVNPLILLSVIDTDLSQVKWLLDFTWLNRYRRSQTVYCSLVLYYRIPLHRTKSYVTDETTQSDINEFDWIEFSKCLIDSHQNFCSNDTLIFLLLGENLLEWKIKDKSLCNLSSNRILFAMVHINVYNLELYCSALPVYIWDFQLDVKSCNLQLKLTIRYLLTM